MKKHPVGLYNLALCFQKGIGVEKNDEKAFHYFRLSAEQGYEKGQGCFLNFLLMGSDLKTAFYNYKLSAIQGNSLSWLTMGHILSNINMEAYQLISENFLFEYQDSNQDNSQSNLHAALFCFKKALETAVEKDKALVLREINWVKAKLKSMPIKKITLDLESQGQSSIINTSSFYQPPASNQQLMEDKKMLSLLVQKELKNMSENFLPVLENNLPSNSSTGLNRH
jgi:hypothetical protein